MFVAFALKQLQTFKDEFWNPRRSLQKLAAPIQNSRSTVPFAWILLCCIAFILDFYS
jgi:hypothetical protein